MHQFLPFTRMLVVLTLVAFVAATVPVPARAGVISTASGIATPAALQRAADLRRILSHLQRADVQSQLQKYGVAPAQAQERIAALSDEEIASLAQRMDTAPVGADDGLFALLGIIFIVLLVLDYTGAVHIFSHRR
jgi:hypothetical protein